jgi:hypothetical protein
MWRCGRWSEHLDSHTLYVVATIIGLVWLCGALLVIAVLSVARSATGSIPSEVGEIGVVTSCTTPQIELEFATIPRCVNGPRDGRRCDRPEDCPQGRCASAPAAPTSVAVSVVDPDRRDQVIGGPVSVTPGPYVAFGLPAAWFSAQSPGVRRRLVVRWTSTCFASNIPCTSDGDCGGQLCMRGTSLFDVRVLPAPGTCP